MARPFRSRMPACLLAGSFLLFACAGCGSPDTKGPAPRTTAQPGGSQANPGQAPPSTPANKPQIPEQPGKAPVPSDRDVVAEPEGVAPVITTPPADLVVRETDPSSMKVVAKGTEPLTYQWSKEGRPEIVCNEAEWWIANPKLEDSGNYAVEVSNRWGKATAFFRLTVNPRLKRP